MDRSTPVDKQPGSTSQPPRSWTQRLGISAIARRIPALNPSSQDVGVERNPFTVHSLYCQCDRCIEDAERRCEDVRGFLASPRSPSSETDEGNASQRPTIEYPQTPRPVSSNRQSMLVTPAISVASGWTRIPSTSYSAPTSSYNAPQIPPIRSLQGSRRPSPASRSFSMNSLATEGSLRLPPIRRLTPQRQHPVSQAVTPSPQASSSNSMASSSRTTPLRQSSEPTVPSRTSSLRSAAPQSGISSRPLRQRFRPISEFIASRQQTSPLRTPPTPSEEPSRPAVPRRSSSLRFTSAPSTPSPQPPQQEPIPVQWLSVPAAQLPPRSPPPNTSEPHSDSEFSSLHLLNAAIAEEEAMLSRSIPESAIYDDRERDNDLVTVHQAILEDSQLPVSRSRPRPPPVLFRQSLAGANPRVMECRNAVNVQPRISSRHMRGIAEAGNGEENRWSRRVHRRPRGVVRSGDGNGNGVDGLPRYEAVEGDRPPFYDDVMEEDEDGDGGREEERAPPRYNRGAWDVYGGGGIFW